MQRVEVEMRLARSDYSTPAIVCIGVMECTFWPYIALLMIYSCFEGKSNKRSDVSKYT